MKTSNLNGNDNEGQARVQGVLGLGECYMPYYRSCYRDRGM
jgi:hypothetical protein